MDWFGDISLIEYELLQVGQTSYEPRMFSLITIF